MAISEDGNISLEIEIIGKDMIKMKAVKKAVICVSMAVMVAGSAVTVFAAETSQDSAESSQSVIQ